MGPFTPFGVGEVERLEREVGLPLPSSYRSFLEAAGGESLMYSVRLPACEPEPLQSFDDLYQLGRDNDDEYGWGTLLGEYRRSRDGWLAHEVSLAGLLPIARNGGSDTLFLDLNPATHGRLHAFVHGIPHPGYPSKGSSPKLLTTLTPTSTASLSIRTSLKTPGSMSSTVTPPILGGGPSRSGWTGNCRAGVLSRGQRPEFPSEVINQATLVSRSMAASRFFSR